MREDIARFHFTWDVTMKGLRALYTLVLCLFAAVPAFAQRTTHVRGYHRRSGAYVAPHYRRAAGSRAHASRSPRTHAPRAVRRPRTRTIRSRPAHVSARRSHSVRRTPARRPDGRPRRSSSARHRFMTSTGYPHGRPGYVVDHRIPLACGGADSPSNMQWQTVADGKAKDRTERIGCGQRHR